MDIHKTDAGLFSVTLEGHVYEFQKYGAEEATDTLLDITLIIGKPLGALVAAVKAAEPAEGPKLSVDAAAAIVEQLTLQIGAHKKLCLALIKKLSSKKCFCDGKAIVFDTHYQDRMGHLLEVVRAALEVQFGNFFAGALQSAAGVRLQASPPVAPPQQAT